MNLKHNHWRIMHPALQQRVAAQPISPEMVLNNSILVALTHSLTGRYSLLFKMQIMDFVFCQRLKTSKIATNTFSVCIPLMPISPLSCKYFV
jgi:hypothetical protein